MKMISTKEVLWLVLACVACGESTDATLSQQNEELRRRRVNGQCGSANGTTTSTAPVADLCSAGIASAVSGSGPWSWTCAGTRGGTTASCSAAPGTSVPSSTELSITSPANGASASGTVTVTGTAGSQWVNVAAFATSGGNVDWSNKLSADVAPSGGTFSLAVDTTKLPDGTDTIDIIAFSVPAGQAGGESATAPLTLVVANAATPPPPPPPPPTGSAQPLGVTGTFNLAFEDNFDGTSLDTSKWTTMDGGGWGNTTCRTSNVAVSGGNLVMTLASATSGGCVCTGSACAPAFGGYFSAGANSFDLKVGGFAEARIYFPGNGADINNWPAWWTSGPGWPAGGEHDIAEGLGTMTVNYHSSTGHYALGTIPGTWSNAFHVYGLHRKAGSADVYYDGVKVKTYTTSDNGSPQSLILDLVGGWGPEVYGAGSRVLVDYVRAWQ